MSRPPSSWRRSAAAALLLAATAACNEGATIGTQKPTAPATVEDGDGTTKPKARGRARETEPIEERPVTVTFVIVDQDGAGRSGVPIGYAGASSGRIVSGKGGRARVALRPGRYRVRVDAGCHDRVEVFEAPAGGTLGVAPGAAPKPVTFKLRMRRRYFASGPITWSPEAPWPSGEMVRFGFAIYDRCTDRPAAGVSFTEFRFRARNLDLVDPTPERSGARGAVTIRFRCERPGDAALFFEDPQNTKDGIDLLSIRSPSFGPTDWCG